MTIHELVYKLEERKQNGGSFDDLQDEILDYLRSYRDEPAPIARFWRIAKQMATSEGFAESDLKAAITLDLITADQLAKIASRAREIENAAHLSAGKG